MSRRTYASWARSVEREAAKRQRELAKQAKEAAKLQEHLRAEHEVAVYVNQIEWLVSMHKDCGDPWNWQELRHRPFPAPPVLSYQRVAEIDERMRQDLVQFPPPTRRSVQEERARLALRSYAPSFFERLLGKDRERIAELERAVRRGVEQDESQYLEDVRFFEGRRAYWGQCRGAAESADRDDHQRALEQHRQAMRETQWIHEVALRVLAKDLSGYRAALDELSPFEELEASGLEVTITDVREDVVCAASSVRDESVVPADEKKIGAGKKLAVKPLPAAQYWGIYQDYVCGAALRIAREILALLPVDRVVVNIATGGIDSSTGHDGRFTVLAVSVPREVAAGLRFDRLDPSDALNHLDHRMEFKKASGFSPVEPMSADEFFVRTGKRK